MNDELKPGEKETKLNFEEATRRNVLAAVAHGNETRKMFRDLEAELKNMQTQLTQYLLEINTIKQQITNIQIKLYAGGSTSGNNN